MPVINTNIVSLSSQLNLSKSNSSLSKAIERLSSGLRINSAKDDAAGQAIANRFTTNIKGLNQAKRNSLDGISIAQTTEAALQETNNNLQRIRELTVQALNGSNAQTDLDSIQAEIDQRLMQINQISEQTQFNGIPILAKDGILKLQVGANDNETLGVPLKKMDVETLDLTGFNVNGLSFSKRSINASPLTIADMPAYKQQTNVTDPTTQNTTPSSVSVSIDGTAFGLTATGANFYPSVIKGNDNQFYAQLTFNLSDPIDRAKLAAVGIDDSNASDTYYFKLSDNLNPFIGFETPLGAQNAPITFNNVPAGSFNLTEIVYDSANLLVQTTARTVKPLKTLDNAISKVDSLRGDLGAIQNRLESVISSLGITSNNLSSSRSRIEDADYALEVSNMSRAQILQQAGTSVLAQANQTPQLVLSLLK
ncbi:FliC/FljB family flagellin [Thorsellia kenyensis]|uniref:Flagellin n=1 Tax=Thorsellia kenyensis TaxID=1549888 RepID=A0ABV6CCK0_9GAMM